jgi:adenylate cyclase
MARQTHFEVHVHQHGRWSIHAQFPANEQDRAIEEGKQLDQQPGVEAIKVIREVYDSEEGTHRDFVVYKSSGAPASDDDEPTSRSTTQSQSQSGWDDFEDDSGGGDDFDSTFGSSQFNTPKKKKKPSSITSILVKLLLVTLFSICIAAMFTVGASTILHGKKIFGVLMTGNAESNILFIAFVGTFLLSAAFLAFTFLRGTTLAEREQKKKRTLSAKAQKKQQAQQVASAKAEQKQERKQAKKIDQEARKELEHAMEGIEDFDSQSAEEKSQEDSDTNDRLKDALDDGSGSEDVAEQTSQEAGDGSLSPHAEKQKAYMMKFLGEAMDGAGTDHKKLDNFNKFGVNMFLAGACETLSQTRELDETSRAKVLADSVRVMGFKKSHAATFAGKYEEYLMQDPRYMQMFQAGRNSMNTYFQDPKAASRHLGSAMEEWNKPKPKEESGGPITVLFTDIAGSTAMTQALGDAGAQQVVRAHNRVVRDALTDHAGKEIKHTGDGIMASFAKTTDGVAASIQMQREAVAHTQQNPELPLHLKIGLNAGEPISEDNDLFGSTVQMSARIVDKAQSEEIFVSEIVRGICDGKGYKFVNRGGYEMKGFAEPPTLFEVVWREDGQAAAE